jgi:hypothetical protein
LASRIAARHPPVRSSKVAASKQRLVEFSTLKIVQI